MQPRLRRVRVVTLVALAVNACGASWLPAIGLWREPDGVRVALGVLGIVLFAAAQAVVLHALVTPWLSERARQRAIGAFAVAALASLPLVGPMGGGWPSWSWMAASIVGLLPVLTGRLRAAVLVVVTVALAALITPGSPIDSLIITIGFGSMIAAINAVHVWLWDLLLQAEQGRAAQARLSAAEERLRFAGDVHDLLGHHLSVIALKAELAERLATVDGPRAAGEAADVRRIAASALSELREVVHGYRKVDLAEQLTAIRDILSSSGVTCTVRAPDGEIAGAEMLATVLREATTNVLRHSRAARCVVEVVAFDGGVRMTITNDGVRDERSPDPHSHGLRGLADRLAARGGTLHTRSAGGEFTVEVVVPSGA
jgi:two-component system, NarL family, sensor histidine kinase DesK